MNRNQSSGKKQAFEGSDTVAEIDTFLAGENMLPTSSAALSISERQRFNALRLVKLTMHSGLSNWERAFIRDVAQLRKLSPKQQALLDRLYRRYLQPKTQ
jgi:hypothetical protein